MHALHIRQLVKRKPTKIHRVCLYDPGGWMKLRISNKSGETLGRYPSKLDTQLPSNLKGSAPHKACRREDVANDRPYHDAPV